jgi:hypothetical protein
MTPLPASAVLGLTAVPPGVHACAGSPGRIRRRHRARTDAGRSTRSRSAARAVGVLLVLVASLVADYGLHAAQTHAAAPAKPPATLRR